MGGILRVFFFKYRPAGKEHSGARLAHFCSMDYILSKTKGEEITKKTVSDCD